MDQTPALLKTTALGFRSGARKILGSLDLELAAGEIKVVVGATGSGKTTLLRLIAGLEIPSDGRIEIDGQLASTSEQILLEPSERRIAMTFQDGALWSHMTVEQHLTFGMSTRIKSNQDRTDLVEELLRLVDLESRRKERPEILSGGERQRLGLARALSLEPRLLLLDEPLAHVDLGARKQLAEKVLSILVERGIGALWVTHHIPSDGPLSDVQVLNLEGGMLSAEGTPR